MFFVHQLLSRNVMLHSSHEIKVSFYIWCDMETLLVFFGPDMAPKSAQNHHKFD